MNEQRAQAYINLIEQLLACADDEELNNILQANQELIDPEFLQVMENYATSLEEQGYNNPAAWLRDMAQQLGQYLNLQAGSIEEYQEFLLEVLQAEYESNSDPTVVYPILQRRQHLLDDTFAQLLQQWARNVFFQGNTEQVAGIARMIQNLCIDIQQFPLGSRANNLEIAITGFQTLLEVYTREAFPYEWGQTQNNLGAAYNNRILGERADNLEKAIAALNQSLEVYTCEAFPYEWGQTQNNLGNAYQTRIKGEKADNLELAISGHTEALKVRTFDAFPQDWAMTQCNLGNAYCDRIREDKAKNLEMAIAAFNEALKIYTFDAFPKQWAATQDNLAIAYRYRIRGDKADNLEMAIIASTEALKVYTFDAFPQDWAATQNNLAGAYHNRIRGNKAENLEMAISAYTEALKVYTFDNFPQDWAMTKNNLANAYLHRIREDKDENLEMAILAYIEALKVITFDNFPIGWAMIQNNLANAYSDRIKGDKAENLEMAISFRTEALKVMTFDTLPQDWAGTQYNLAHAYFYRVRGGKDDNLKIAIQAYKNALTIYTKEKDPLHCLKTARDLAILHYNEKQWQSATEAYHIAIEAVENTRLEALNPQRQQEILSEAMDVYHGIVQSYLNLNQKDRALEYVERSKTRYLVQLLTERDIYPKGNIPQTIITELDRLRRAIIGEEQRLAIQEQTRNRGEILTLDQQKQPILNDYTHLNHLKQELNQFIDREITKIDENFILTQTVKPIPFQDILSLTDAETCLLQWYITSEKILAFVVSADGNINLWESSEDDRNKLTDLINNYLQLYYSQNGHQEWINQLSDLLQTFSDTLHINDILALIPNTCKRLIIIPYLFLHILPLHALPINDNQILQDKYDVQYAPSCQLFKITQQRQLNDLNSLFAIQNPQNNLLFTDLEVEIIKSLFVQSDILAKQNATEIAIKTHQNFPLANCIHFSCHGTFNPNKPLESALILTKEKTDQEDGYLRLGEIFELNFKNCRLVMLSACETGLIDLNSISDEYIGLPSGFLFAGSPSVVSSLWKVNDLSTAFLLIKFYETLPKNPQKGEIAVSLKNAQKWLQTLTLDQFEQELERFQLQLDKIINQLGGGKRPIFNESLKQIRQRQPYPFKNPYYWAGFIATGF
ncbi:CHAT domain-containing protein [Microcystis aeruginosa]|uniref:CHAT domain-containing protein n=1 Tax=Microcystis aeruginosa 11-30S32 TaxID=2358142 RepID=A0A510PDZ0_MICAE|nr:CHAT domain-containing protein [Microcystis aeruginosa]GCA91971.1 CHAT domain-containing protein [Microcystis aeruginosa 11-30S32]